MKATPTLVRYASQDRPLTFDKEVDRSAGLVAQIIIDDALEGAAVLLASRFDYK